MIFRSHKDFGSCAVCQDPFPTQGFYDPLADCSLWSINPVRKALFSKPGLLWIATFEAFRAHSVEISDRPEMLPRTSLQVLEALRYIDCSLLFLFALLGGRKPSEVKLWRRFPSSKRPDRPFLKTSILEADLEGQDHTFPWWEKLAFRERHFWHHKFCGRSWPGRFLSMLPVSVSTSVSVHGDPSPQCWQSSKYFFSFLHEFLFLPNPDVSGPSPKWTKMLLHYLDSRWRNPQSKRSTPGLDPCNTCYGEMCITVSSSSHVDQTSRNKRTPEL